MDTIIIGVSLAILTAAVWGSTVFLFKSVLKTESLLTSNLIRSLAATIFVFVIVIVTGGVNTLAILFSPSIFLLIVFSTFTQIFAEITYFFSLRITNASVVQAVSSCSPLFLTILVFFSNIEPVSGLMVLGTCFIVLGVFLITQSKEEGNGNDQQEKKDLVIGIILSIITAFLWALGFFALRLVYVFPSINTNSLAGVRLATLTMFAAGCWISVFLFNSFQKDNSKTTIPQKSISAKNIGILSIGGILTWGIGSIAFYESIRLIGAAKATPISSANPLVTVIIGLALFKEELNKIQLLGIFFIIIGSIAIPIG
jgi:drug/metabolite transporter (DMT)-like permease